MRRRGGGRSRSGDRAGAVRPARRGPSALSPAPVGAELKLVPVRGDSDGAGGDLMAAIRTEGLAKSFGATVALRPLDLEVAEGEVLGYLGPNGAGKTTTIRCLLGLIRASAGRAEIFGVDAQANPGEAHRRVAYVPGEASLWPGLTGRETLHLLGNVQGQV